MSTIDWSASAAWTAFGVSALTSFAGIVINGFINYKLKKLEMQHGLEVKNIENQHEAKMKEIENLHNKAIVELETFHTKRFDAISSYLIAAGAMTTSKTPEATAEYHKALGNAALYLPEELYQKTLKFEIDASVGAHNTLCFRELAEAFSSYGFAAKQKLW